MAAPEKPEKSRLQQIAEYSSLGFQTVGIIGGGAWLGSLLDKKYQTEKSWFTLAFVLVFIVISMMYTIRKLNGMNNDK
jgi:F0F1-type ATP synthase assembly protein I